MPEQGQRHRLHWSIDYDIGPQAPDFGIAMLDTLERWSSSDAGDPALCRYVVLPNYEDGWDQLRAHNADSNIQIGSAVIRRRVTGDGVRAYEVDYRNDTSGETLALQFIASDEPLPRLQGEWSVTARNDAGDQYQGIRLRGSTAVIDAKRVVTLTVNGIQFDVGAVAESAPLTSWWALFDAVPAMASGAATADGFALLEDLQKLRPQCTVTAVKGDPITLGGHRLRGYCLYGTGVLPTYWWLDEHGVVCVVSSTFQTLVRQGSGDIGDAS